ncbi:hypothetical protein [Mariniflexile sp.]|uniref:hypothetical protein n=1 Tax=Mariniflexile sp. TaxID=1979402 RepID=UPI0040487C5C
MKKINKYYRIIVTLIIVLQFSSCTEDANDESNDGILDNNETGIITNDTATTGQAMFWMASDLGVGNITVSCNGSSKLLDKYYNSGIPNCGAIGAANFILNPGTFSFSAKGGALIWNGTITVTNGGCSKVQLTNSGIGGGGVNLNGKWLGTDGRTFTISGSNGVFNSFGTGNWKSAYDKGLVKVGDLYLKNISNVNSTKWNVQPLWVAGVNGVVNEVKWGTNGTIVISANSNTFTLTGTDPFDGLTTKSATFTRTN